MVRTGMLLYLCPFISIMQMKDTKMTILKKEGKNEKGHRNDNQE
jgi:hypothetical protein